MVVRAFDGISLADGEAAVVELKDGWFNASYLIHLANGREVILKIAPPKDAEVMVYEKNIMTTEVTLMGLVRQNPAIPVPEIYYYDFSQEVCDAAYFFMEKIEGENLEQAKANLNPETLTAVKMEIGGIIREVNSFPGQYFGYDGNPALRAATWKAAYFKIVESVLEDAARKKLVFGFNYDELREAIQKHAPALDEITKPCLVHWDAWDPNFFVKNGRITGIIDFERALWADPLMEAQFRPLAHSGISASLRGYGKTSFTFAEQQRNHLYSLHLALVMNTECTYRNYDTDYVFNLSRHFIKETMDWLTTN